MTKYNQVWELIRYWVGVVVAYEKAGINPEYPMSQLNSLYYYIGLV